MCNGKFTATEVETVIEAVGDGWYDLPETITLRGDEVSVTEVERVGGEGEGDHLHVVFKVGDQLFMKTGYYVSHYGSEWDGDVTEVREVQKTITAYEAV